MPRENTGVSIEAVRLSRAAAMRAWRAPLLAAMLALLSVAPAAASGAAAGGRPAHAAPPYWLLRGPGVTAFGAFAGYVWRGDERSIGASWTVPRIMPSTQTGLALAGTWIGAQTTGPGRPPFIQVGVNEVRSPFGNAYFAFYSDTKLSFHPHTLFRTRAGDAISARLRLAGGRWHVLIVDHTHPHKAAFATTDDADASFNQAEWLQEEPRYATGRLVAYPLLSTVGFRRLRVNAGAPQYGKLRSQWMSENGEDLAPSPLVNDAFSFAPTQPTVIGMHYLQITVALDIALDSFDAHLERWTVRTPGRAIAAQRAAIAAALTANIQAVAASRWPAGVQPLCNRLIAAAKVELAQANRQLTLNAAGIRQWVIAWDRAGSHASGISMRVRRLLNLPQLFPLPRNA